MTTFHNGVERDCNAPGLTVIPPWHGRIVLELSYQSDGVMVAERWCQESVCLLTETRYGVMWYHGVFV